MGRVASFPGHVVGGIGLRVGGWVGRVASFPGRVVGGIGLRVGV